MSKFSCKKIDVKNIIMTRQIQVPKQPCVRRRSTVLRFDSTWRKPKRKPKLSYSTKTYTYGDRIFERYGKCILRGCFQYSTNRRSDYYFIYNHQHSVWRCFRETHYWCTIQYRLQKPTIRFIPYNATVLKFCPGNSLNLRRKSFPKKYFQIPKKALEVQIC